MAAARAGAAGPGGQRRPRGAGSAAPRRAGRHGSPRCFCRRDGTLTGPAACSKREKSSLAQVARVPKLPSDSSEGRVAARTVGRIRLEMGLT